MDNSPPLSPTFQNVIIYENIKYFFVNMFYTRRPIFQIDKLLISRQLFQIAIQAAIGGRIIARET
ncbi:MAG: hypothetical protein ACJBCI_07135, partial [Candidatus Tisiphia sp.]